MTKPQLGKAMVVSIDKATAVRMYDKVQAHWKAHLAYLMAELETCSADEQPTLEAKVKVMQETDMAVVVSQSQNEIEDIKKKGADITPHRKRMLAEDLDTKFKDPADPFRIVFVCAMWMTGFDVPCCSTIYLDKPMRNHTLMQTIARANRVFPDKVNGLIVDYIGVFRDLQKALAIYGSASGGGVQPGELPVQGKAALIEKLRQAIAEATATCAELGIDLGALQAADDIYQHVKLLEDAVEAVLVNDESKRKFLGQVVNVDRLFKAILPDQAANEFSPTRAALVVITDKLHFELPDVDISDVMTDVESLLDRSVAAQAYVIHEPAAPYDLSRIDFAKLQKAFARSHKHTEAAKLQAAISAKLQRMVALNKSRLDYAEQFQKMIDEYNAGASDVDLHFARLVAFVQGLNDEEQRGIKEQLSEEELAVFDLLTKPDIKLTRAERAQVKQVA
jgi:type I restriction enzyme, R subunit